MKLDPVSVQVVLQYSLVLNIVLILWLLWTLSQIHELKIKLSSCKFWRGIAERSEARYRELHKNDVTTEPPCKWEMDS